MRRLLILAAAMIVSAHAVPQTKPPYPFEGDWLCGGMLFKFTSNTYDQGGITQRIRRVQFVKAGDYRLAFKDNYSLFVRVLSPAEMRWISEASGDSFECTRQEPASMATAPLKGSVYTTSDAESLMDKLVAAAPQKSQFETTAAFEKRRMQVLSPMLDAPPARETWLQLVEPKHVRYDADAGAVKFPSFLLKTVALSEVEAVEGQYTGTNAFGAKADVVRRKIFRKQMAWDARFDSDIAIPLPVSIAEPQWRHLRVVLLSSVWFRPVKERQYTVQPKIDAPYEDTVTELTMEYRADRIAILNSETKAVVANLPFVYCREQFGGGTLKPGRC